MGKIKIPDLQKEALQISKQLWMHDQFNITKLYLGIDNLFRKYNEKNKLNGQSVIIPMQTGVTYKFICYKNVTALESSEGKVYISKDMSKEEAKWRLELINDVLSDVKVGIGPEYPDDFKKHLETAKKGEMLIYNITSFIVKEKTNSQIILKEFNINCNNTKLENINNNLVYINLNDSNSIQNLYNYIADKRTANVSVRFIKKEYRDKSLSEYTKNLKNKEIKKIQLGNNFICVQNQNGKYHWFDENGTTIDEETAKTIITWANNAPVEYTYISDKHDLLEEYESNEFINQIQQLSANQDFDQIVATIKEECIRKNNKVLIKINSLKKNKSGNFEYINYGFVNTDRGFTIYEIELDNNENVSKLKPVPIKDFIEFCKTKFNEKYMLIQNDITEACLNRNISLNKEQLTDLTNKASKENMLIKDEDIFSINNSIDSLLNALSNDKSKPEKIKERESRKKDDRER